MQTQDTLPPRVSVSCAHCGKAFETWRSYVAKGNGRFCSHKCAGKAHHPGTLAERFWAKVDRSDGPDACWLWTGATTGAGYGRITLGSPGPSPLIQATHVAWGMANGPVPDGIEVLHNCPTGDNPRCVNPSHLFLGTQAVNMADKVAKDRQHKGEQIHNAKLTGEEVDDIRTLYASGTRVTDLATLFGVCHQHISDLVNRRKWTHR